MQREKRARTLGLLSWKFPKWQWSQEACSSPLCNPMGEAQVVSRSQRQEAVWFYQNGGYNELFKVGMKRASKGSLHSGCAAQLCGVKDPVALPRHTYYII